MGVQQDGVIGLGFEDLYVGRKEVGEEESEVENELLIGIARRFVGSSDI